MKTTKRNRKRNRIISIALDAVCLVFTPVYLVMSEIDERWHRGKEWDVSPPTPPTKTCPHCQHATPLSSNYCTYCGTYLNTALRALTVPSFASPLHMPKSHSAILRALAAAGSPAYDKSHSHPRLLAASVLFPGDTASVPRVSGNLYRERDTPPGTWHYDGEVSNG